MYSLTICLFSVILCVTIGLETEKNCDCNSPNVRTVLFHESDLRRDCWSREDIALLFSRMLMQRLIPKTLPFSLPRMLEYFQTCFDTVKKMAPCRRTQAILLSAFADAIGGYLQAYGVPLTNRAFYEGNENCKVAKQIHNLQDTLKKSLNTDGGGWTKPNSFECSINTVEPLRIPTNAPCNACANIISENCVIHQFTHPKNGEKSNDTQKDLANIKIPLPFLDDDRTPCTVAVPFKNRSLYSLFNTASCDILVQYYVTSVQCLKQASKLSAGRSCDGNSALKIRQFDERYYCWLYKVIIPHLSDERWYPGFGGVLRIVETMKAKRVDLNAGEGNELEPSTEEALHSCNQEVNCYVIALIMLALLIMFLMCCLCCLIRRCSNGDDECETSTTSCESDSTGVRTLISLYCGMRKCGKCPESSSSSHLPRSVTSMVDQGDMPNYNSSDADSDRLPALRHSM